MKKICIITYHNPCNYGATLQALATVIFLKDCGFDVEIIDYVPSSRRNFGNLKSIIRNNKDGFHGLVISVIKNISYKKMKRRFDNFSDSLLPLTKEYRSLEELKKDVPKADIYCTGSDQVWNNYYTGDFEDAFFLDFIPNEAACFSFSASFGKSTFNKEELKRLKEKLKKYNFITVREEDGKKIALNLGYKGVKQILDPTLLIDEKKWNDYTSNRVIKNKYVLVYQLHGDSDTLKYAKKFAKENKLKIVKINTMIHHYGAGVKNVYLPDIKDFLWYIKNAEYVFTDSFHGVAFSIIYGRRLGITLPSHFNNRITSLIDQLNCGKYVIDNYNEWRKTISDTDAVMYSKVLSQIRLNNASLIKKYLRKYKTK